MSKNLNNVKVSISPGNTKMGAVPSVSLPPVVTCASGCLCAKKCYAAKLCRLRASVRNAYQRNLEILTHNPAAYWLQVETTIAISRFFRFHVAGDIVNADYLQHMNSLAKKYPYCEILCFTKKYDLVNDFYSTHEKPENLHLILSAWPGMELKNPLRLPVAHVIFKGTEPLPEWKICGGNCCECACRGVGCWQLKTGEDIAFYEH